MIEPTTTEGSLSEKADAAFDRVVKKVLERARQTGTPVVLWQDEQVKFIPPEEVEGGTAEGAKGTAKGAKGAKEAEG
ncbi:MAG UNVERIFIED_CONTAM: hypothetical protein LVR18_19235 [Planctomycetaceae bacterium]|jgi:hypothetical protein